MTGAGWGQEALLWGDGRLLHCATLYAGKSHRPNTHQMSARDSSRSEAFRRTVGTPCTGPSSPLPRPVPPSYFMGTLLNALLRPMLCGCHNPNCHNKALLASQCKRSGTELQANVYKRRRDHIIIIQVCAIGVGKGGTQT